MVGRWEAIVNLGKETVLYAFLTSVCYVTLAKVSETRLETVVVF